MNVVYHATRNRFFHKIQKEGLHAKKKKSFEGQEGEGLIYFAYDDDVAASYVETADNIPESWENDEIIVLAVKKSDINCVYVFQDPNIIGEDWAHASTFAYELPVPPQYIGILNFKNKKIEPILKVNKLSDKYYY